MRLAYLTSQYPATSHTFIRREIFALRASGQEVETFSVRAPSKAELVAEDDRKEAAQTFTLLARPAGDFLAAHLQGLLSSPRSYVRTFRLALRHRPPGAKAALLALAHFAEGILLGTELKRRHIDHLHNHFANSGATVGLLASSFTGIRWSFTIHGISEFDYPAGLLLPAKIEAAQFVACVSYFGRAQAFRLVAPQSWPKLQIVRCGLELDRLPSKARDPDGRFRLIFVGRLSPEKGLAGLLEALSVSKLLSRIDLIIVGDGPLADAARSQAERLGIASNVKFLGRLSEQETLAEIASSDSLVLPSFMEGLPVVLMEALALGVPVIASRVAGIPELVRDGETGILFDPSHWSQLADAIDRMAGDGTLHDHLGRAGPQRIAEEFDVRLSAARLRDLFAGVVPSEAIPTVPPVLPKRNTSAPSTGHKAAF
jgi:colanic acid/amylovoran biosynthesis glycosyltransferase